MMINSQTDLDDADILIVDDKLANLRLLTNMLSDLGCQVRGVSNGAMALRASSLDPPDLILLDVNMPEMNGYEVCQQLKADELTTDIPVIFISALDEVLDKVRAFAAGGADYISKPFQLEEVLARVVVQLKNRSLQQQLEKEVEALQASNNELDAFARTVAHDINNPIGEIALNAELLRMKLVPKNVDEKTLRRAMQIESSAKNLANIVKELLLLARVRKEDVNTAPVAMASVVAGARERLAEMIDEHKAELELPAKWPEAIGYAPWLEEVWVNYLSNGIKYGGRPPRLRLGATSEAEGIVRFWVRDNGPGIASEAQAQLFNEFTRLDGTRATGYGLGLTVVKRIITKLDGEVGLASQVGKGSTFYFELPSLT